MHIYWYIGGKHHSNKMIMKLQTIDLSGDLWKVKAFKGLFVLRIKSNCRSAPWLVFKNFADDDNKFNRTPWACINWIDYKSIIIPKISISVTFLYFETFIRNPKFVHNDLDKIVEYRQIWWPRSLLRLRHTWRWSFD